MKINVKKLIPEAVIPSYAKPGDAGLDLTATSIDYREGQMIYGTGLAVEIPAGFVGLIFPRSSICKTSLELSNSVGVIDSGYRGEIKFFFNINPHRSQMPEYNVGDRVGQLVVMPYPQIELVEKEELSSTERGEGGFGSSGS